MTYKYYKLILILICFLAWSCEDDEDSLNGTGVVSFALPELFEIENADTPLSVNIAIDNFNHSGGTIAVSITGANYGEYFETNKGSSEFEIEVAAQSLSESFSILPIDNDLIEGNKILTIQLTSVTGALELGDNTSMTFVIIEDDDPLVALVEFETLNIEIEENAVNSTIIQIPFDQASTEGGTISVSSSGTAVLGTDYTVESQSTENFTLTIPAGATSASFTLNPIDNAVFEADKTLTFSIDEVTGGLALGVQNQTTITLVNDDLPPNPVIDLSAANPLNVSEDSGTVNIDFVLSSTTSLDATIEITTSGTTDNADFNLNGSTDNPFLYTIPAGSSTATIDLNIIDDAIIETDETITLTITSVTGGLDPGLNLQQQTITITDNDTAAFNYVETFETVADLDAAGFQAFLLPTQDLPGSKLFKYNMNVGKYADVDDVTQDSDTGLVVFYNITQNGEGTLDNIVVTPQMQVTGDVDVSIDIAYSQAPNINNAVITFYYSETYDGSQTWNESDWISMGTETAAGMETDGFGTLDYKRKVMNISPSANFYVAVRVNQTMDATFTKTQWRLDNFKVNN